MPILAFLASLFTPVTEIFKSAKSAEEKLKEAEVQITKIQGEVQTKLIELEVKTMEFEAKIRESEAGSDSWLQKSWRPIMSLGFGAIIMIVLIVQLFGPALDIKPILSSEYTFKLLEYAMGFIGGYGLARTFFDKRK